MRSIRLHASMYVLARVQHVRAARSFRTHCMKLLRRPLLHGILQGKRNNQKALCSSEGVDPTLSWEEGVTFVQRTAHSANATEERKAL